MSHAVNTPFTQYSKLVTTRLRSRVHGQSFANAFAEAEGRKQRQRANPAVKAATACADELATLKAEHRRGFDPTLKARAVQRLQSMPILSAEDDPHFTCTLRALRVAAYFNAVHASSTFALLNQLTKHAYLLDGFHMFQVSRILLELEHPRTAEVLHILLPRMREVAAADVTATEACSLLEVLSVYDVGQQDTVLLERLTQVMRRTIKDLDMHDVTQCVAALRFVPSALLARPVLQAAEARLCELLEEAALSRQVYTASVFLASHATAIRWPGSQQCPVMKGGGAAPDSAVESRPTAVAGEQTGDAAELEGEWAADKENRQLLLTHMREGRTLVRELTRTCTALALAPRRVLNALARTVVAYTDPRPTSRATQKAPSDSSDAAHADGDEANGGDEAVVFEEEKLELNELWKAMPHLTSRDMGFFLRLLSAANYRHERALRLLSARIASSPSSSSSSSHVARGERRSGGAVPAPSASVGELSDCATAVEALAFFYMTDTAATVTALLRKMVELRGGAPTFIAPQQMLIVVDVLSRIFLSLTRLRYVPAALAATATAEGDTKEEVVRCLATLLSDDALQWFAGGGACVRQPLLSAQLVSGVAQLQRALEDGTPQTSPSSASAAAANTTRLVTQLLEGVRRSGLDRMAGTAGARADAQRSVADAVEAVKALRSLDGRLTAALHDVEALSLQLL